MLGVAAVPRSPRFVIEEKRGDSQQPELFENSAEICTSSLSPPHVASNTGLMDVTR